MLPMPNLSGIGDIILIQNLKTGIYYIDVIIILLFLFLLHHSDINTHVTRFIFFCRKTRDLWELNGLSQF